MIVSSNSVPIVVHRIGWVVPDRIDLAAVRHVADAAESRATNMTATTSSTVSCFTLHRPFWRIGSWRILALFWPQPFCSAKSLETPSSVTSRRRSRTVASPTLVFGSIASRSAGWRESTAWGIRKSRSGAIKRPCKETSLVLNEQKLTADRPQQSFSAPVSHLPKRPKNGIAPSSQTGTSGVKRPRLEKYFSTRAFRKVL